MTKSKLNINKILKLCLLTSVAISYAGATLAGDMHYPTPDEPTAYPSPLPPTNYPTPTPPMGVPAPMPPQMPLPPTQPTGGSDSNFSASIEVSATYRNFQVNDGTTTTTDTQKIVELRPFISFETQNGGLDFSTSLMTSLAYEIGGTPAYSVGNSELDLLVKKEGDFAFGLTGNYEVKSFTSTSPLPAETGRYHDLEIDTFAEKIFGNWGVSLTGSYISNLHDATAQTAGPDFAETAKDFNEIGATLRINYDVDPAMTIFVETFNKRKVFAVVSAPSKNETVFGTRLGTTYNMNNKVAFEVAGQYAYRKFDGVGANIQHAYGADAKMVAKFTKNSSGFVSVSGEYLRNTAAVTNTKRIKVEGGIDFEITDQLSASVNGEYDVIISGPTTGTYVSSEVEVNYDLNNNIGVYAGVSSSHKVTSSPGWKKDLSATLGLSLSY